MTEQYDVIDLSAHGPNRGLLVAVESIHETRGAPPLFHASPSHSSVVAKATTKDAVFCALTREFQDMRALVRTSGYSEPAIRAALRNLVTQGFAESRRVDQASAFQGSQIKAQWRRLDDPPANKAPVCRVSVALQQHGALTVAQLRAETGLTTGSIDTILWRLRKRGWITESGYDPTTYHWRGSR